MSKKSTSTNISSDNIGNINSTYSSDNTNIQNNNQQQQDVNESVNSSVKGILYFSVK